MPDSAYVPGFEHDIFVSYARVDNEPDFEGEVGWVSTLQDVLTRRLRKLIGRDCFSIWRDQDTAKHIDFEPQIVRSLEQSAALLLILSPGYLRSEWCTRELRTFLKLVRERGSCHGGVFVVYREKMDLRELPDELQRANLTGYPFWTQEREKRPRPLEWPRDRHEFADAVYNLADEIARCLQKMCAAGAASLQPLGGAAVRHAARPAPPDAETSDLSAGERPATVFLAESTDDIDDERGRVKRYFEQLGLQVVPGGFYPREPSAFRQAVREDLSQAKLFIQLLSRVPGRRLPDGDETYVAYQHRAAVEMQVPVLQWRDPELTVEWIEARVGDAAHRDLLLGASVEAVDIEDFKHDVVQRANRRESSFARPEGDLLVFVNSATADCPLAADLGQHLLQRGCGLLEPVYEGRPEDIRKVLHENVVNCDGMIVVYGHSESEWVRGQLLEARKAAISNSRPLHAAIYEGPPTPKSPLGVKLPRMHVIPCHEGLDGVRLQPFLEELRRVANDHEAAAAPMVLARSG